MKFTIRAAAAAFLIAPAVPAMATECIAPANPGGGWDFTCRQIGKIMTDIGLTDGLVQVTNLAGAGGGIAFSTVVNERNDDEDLFVAASSATTTRLAQDAFAGATADQVRWVGSIGGDPGVIVVAADSDIQNLDDLIASVKEDPSKFAFAGGSAVGGFDHLKVLMMLSRAGIDDPTSVKYIGVDGGADAITRTVGGFTQAMTGDLSEITGFIDSGDVRPIVVFSEEPVEGFDIPTAKEQGVDLVAMNWRGVYAPKDISDEAYDKWVDWLGQVAESDQWKQAMKDNGLAPFTKLGDEFQTFVDENIAEISDISKRIGIIQ